MTNPTPARSIRVPDKLWAEFKAAAQRRNSTASAVLIVYMEKYVRNNREDVR